MVNEVAYNYVGRTRPGTNWSCDEQGRIQDANMAASIETFQK